ncbi:MAG: Smr/MutS family protein [Proteobacteria bacterium]|nr:Smr/MutS family protein [Pseudomonadota bacterium]
MAKDVDLFAAAMASVTPLKGGRRAKSPPAPGRTEAPPRPTETPAPSAPARVGASPLPQAFDADVARALARGKRAPEASLDLHGMTLVAAERAVARFLATSSAEGHRVVLIVTGKGMRLEGGRVFGGRIRAEFPNWLEREDNRALIAGVRGAHPRHGGSGAFYVLLRRRSSASSRSLRATPQR